MKHRCITPSTLLGLVGTVLAAGAATVPLAPPPPSAFADTESAVTYPLAGWNDLTRFYSLSMEVETNAVSCVQVAFGTDRNSDGDLAPEETALVLGVDCGTPFIRDEVEVVGGGGQRWFASASSAQESTLDCSPSPLVFNFSFKQPSAVSQRLNFAKVTTRGRSPSAAEIAAEIRKPGKVLFLR